MQKKIWKDAISKKGKVTGAVLCEARKETMTGLQVKHVLFMNFGGSLSSTAREGCFEID